MQDAGTHLNDDIILEFERQLQIKLPLDYKEFMKKNNGGTPLEDWIFHFVESASVTSSVIRDFFIIRAKETSKYDDLRRIYRIMKEEGQISPSQLPIASDPGDNIILLTVIGDNFGKVYFGNHELTDINTGGMKLSLIANTFTDFLKECILDK